MEELKIIQITNIPIQVTKDQMYAMFECIGDIEDIQLYPKKRCTTLQSRICFIKFSSSASVELARYLNNTHLMDKLLQVTPYFNDGRREEIPNERNALEILTNDSCSVISHTSKSEVELLSEIHKVSLELQKNGLPPYPSLPFNCEPAKVDEIRRTIVVSNLDESISGQQVLDHFSGVGEVKYVRICKRSDGEHCCLVEFSLHESVIQSLKLNNSEIVLGRKVKVYHSVHAIEKSMEVILNGVVINNLASSLIEAACQESVGKRNSENVGQEDKRRSHSKSESPCSRRSHKYRKSKSERRSHSSRRSKSRERRRHSSRERRRRSSGNSGRVSKKSSSKERNLNSDERKSRCVKSKSKDRSSEGEEKSRKRSPKERPKSLPEEKSRSREETRSRSKHSRSRSRSRRSKSERSKSRKRSRSRERGSRYHRKW